MRSVCCSGRVWVVCLVMAFALLGAGCGDGDDGDRRADVDVDGGGDTGAGGDAGGSGCTVTATAVPDLDERTVTGIGAVQCDAAATLSVETCVQWDASGTFEDLQCRESTESGTAGVQVENLASCGIGSGRSFRARVNASVDGTALPEALSAEVACE